MNVSTDYNKRKRLTHTDSLAFSMYSDATNSIHGYTADKKKLLQDIHFYVLTAWATTVTLCYIFNYMVCIFLTE